MLAERFSRLHLRALLLLGRPLHLVGGCLFYSLGLAIARWQGLALARPIAFWGLGVVLATQLMIHYSNDYFDYRADLANTNPTRWSGGSRVLVDGLLPRQFALALAIAFGLLAVLGTLVVSALSAAPLATVLLLALALALGWSYSSPPLVLNQRALGEISASLLGPGLTTLVGYQLQVGSLGLVPLLATLPLCAMQFLMLLAVNWPDAAGDRAVGKTTLVVLLGAQGAARLYLLVLLLTYATLPLLGWAGLPWPVVGLLLLAAPIAASLGWRVWQGAWHQAAAWDSLGFWSIGLLMSSGAFALLGFLWLA